MMIENEKKEKFLIQEHQYKRAYHHLVDFDNFKIHDYLSWGLEYFGYSEIVLDLFSKYNVHTNMVADVGCGDGKVTIQLAKKYTDISFEGFDLSEPAILFAKAFSTEIPNINFFQKDFSISDKKFDVILCMETFEHIPDAEIASFINLLKDKLIDGGIIIVTVPSTFCPVSKKHYRHYTQELLMQQMSGFTQLDILYGHKKRLGNFLNRLLANKYFIVNHLFLRRVIFNLYIRFAKESRDNGTHVIGVFRKE